VIVRTGNRPSDVIDHGPAAPSKRNTVPAGMLARPGPTGRVAKERNKPDPNYNREWKRRKRATDPEWHARELARDRAYAARRAAAAKAEAA
jgi:hypothetical protein